MSVPVPIAIRIYNLGRGFDYHITKWVDDFSFRHTAPGGCASATFKLHYPRDLPNGPETWGKLFTRVQIIDRRDAQVLWEGRVEDPAQRSDEDTWELGVLGSAVAATDVTIPFIYQDNSLEHWDEISADGWEHTKDESGLTLTTKLGATYIYNAGQQFDIWAWNGGQANGATIARATCTYDASGPNTTQDDFFDQILSSPLYGNLDVTTFNAAVITKVNLMPDDAQFPDGLISQLYFSFRRNSTNYTIAASDNTIIRFKNPKIQTIRVDRFGNPLLTSIWYAHGDFVYVRMVVEDVIGRWLVGNWTQGLKLDASANPFGCVGSVKGSDAYVDISNNAKITNLQFPSGATAKDVLEVLMGVQTNAYWAIWESDHLANESYSASGTFEESRFRFEWATWPESWNYTVSSRDGMDQQIAAENCYSQIANRMVYDTANQPFILHMESYNPFDTHNRNWDISETFLNQFDRVLFTDNTSNPVPGDGDTHALTYAEGSEHGLPSNAGTITVRRAVHCYDNGNNSHHGYVGMMEPWELRPGKLVLIRDLMPWAEADWMKRGLEVLNPNTDFEVNTTGWTSEGGTFVRDTAQHFSGVASGKITPNGVAANVAIIGSQVNVTIGRRYRVSAQVRNAVARNVWLRIYYYEYDGTFLTTEWFPFAVAATTWTLLSTDIFPPAQANTALVSVFMGGSDGIPPASNILWIDDVTFEEYATIPLSHHNCVFRVAATEYNASDNSCKLELDELPKWSVATQIANPAGGGITVQ